MLDGLPTYANIGMSLLSASYAAQISWKLRKIDNTIAQDLRWLCCSFVWILSIWPVKFFLNKGGFTECADVASLLMVAAMVALVVCLYRLFGHLSGD